MTYLHRKLKFLIAIFAIMATSSVQADNGSQWANCCPQNETCCPQTCCTGGFYFDAEALYLRAYEGGLSGLCDISVSDDIIVGDDFEISNLVGKGQEPDFRWDWGFRLGAGYQFACSNCSARVYWTHFQGDTKGCVNRFKLDYDVADVIFRCDCSCQSCVTLTPFAGLKFANIDQKVRTRFESIFDDIPSISRDHVKQEFKGFGPLLGLEGRWNADCGFGAYGNVAVALLYGRNHVRSSGIDTFETGINTFNLRNRKNAYQFVVDFGLGVQWRKQFCGNKFLVVQLGFEDHRYFDHNQFNDYGDLSLDGVSLGLSFEY